MASIKDVANDAGVSVATVSYVINNNKYVSPELKLKVLNSVKKLNYNANLVARSLRNKKTGIIGVVLQNIRNAFFPQLLSGLEEYARQKNYNLLFFNTYYDIETEKNVISNLRNMWVDGIILDSCVVEKDLDEYNEFLTEGKGEKRIPIVTLERKLGGEQQSSISIDNFGGAYTATNYLIEKGRDKIAYIAGSQDWNMLHDRLKGFKAAVEDKKLMGGCVIKYGSLRPQDGYEIMKELLVQDSSINAVFAANDQMAIGALKAVKEFGLVCPRDIHVIGFDNIFVTTMIEPTLTTVNVPKYIIGKKAAQVLIDQIENPESEYKHIVLPTNMIIRQSTDIHGERNWELYGW